MQTFVKEKIIELICFNQRAYYQELLRVLADE